MSEGTGDEQPGRERLLGGVLGGPGRTATIALGAWEQNKGGRGELRRQTSAPWTEGASIYTSGLRAKEPPQKVLVSFPARSRPVRAELGQSPRWA